MIAGSSWRGRRHRAHPIGIDRTATLARRVLERTSARIGLALATIVLAFVVIVPAVSAHGPYAQDGLQLQAPSSSHWLGTDQVGRDVLVRVAVGGRRTLQGAAVALSVAVLIGITVGVTAAVAGRVLDAVLMRTVDALNGLPPLIIPIALVGALGPSYTNLLVSIVIGYVPSYARIARTFAETVRGRLDITTARLHGISRARIARTHVIPSVFAQMLVIATLDIGSVIVSLSGLSFLGLGAQAPDPEWGVLLGDGQVFFTPAPWLLIAPAAVVTLVIVGANLLGESMRDTIAERDGRGR
jgi:peptide/nickel transport system permease protein